MRCCSASAATATVHFLNAAGDGELPVPMELMPLLAGLGGLGFAVVFGYMATKQRATAFAMITLGHRRTGHDRGD